MSDIQSSVPSVGSVNFGIPQKPGGTETTAFDIEVYLDDCALDDSYIGT